MLDTTIDTVIHKQLANEDGPGVAVAVVKDRQLLHCQGYGKANLEWDIPITPSTVLGLGSITKQFTATALMLLEQQGKLQLDEPLQMYLPDYPTHDRQITVRHLLTHTSGITNFVTRPDFWEKHAYTAQTTDDVIAIFKDLPLDFAPGTRYSYNNSGYVLLGAILEKLCGVDYGECIQQLIFTPLGMAHSHYLRPETIIPDRADGYTPTEQGYQHVPQITAATRQAAGGLGTTIEDMLRWDTALREGSLLDHATLARIYAPLELSDGRKENYGLGWVLGNYRGHAVLCHAGGVPGFSAFFGRFPDDGVTIIILSNNASFNAQGLARKLAYLTLGRPTLTRVPALLDPTVVSHSIGSYHSVFGEHSIQEEAGQLFLVENTVRHPLTPSGPTSFYQTDDEHAEVHVERPDEQGDYRSLRVVWPFAWLIAER